MDFTALRYFNETGICGDLPGARRGRARRLNRIALLVAELDDQPHVFDFEEPLLLVGDELCLSFIGYGLLSRPGDP
jgi:hypothetical protein